MKIHTCIWYNNTAQEAVKLYASAFGEVKMVSDSGMVVMFEIKGLPIMGVNGGDNFRPTPAFSYYVSFDTEQETEKAWDILVEEGKTLMALDKYDWNSKYGWLEDKYGVSWQLWTGPFSKAEQKVVPGLMYCNKVQGKAEEAINLYTSLFPDSSRGMTANYPDETPEIAGQIVHAEFTLNNVLFKAFDSGIPHGFDFTEGMSVVVHCDSQSQIDRYWNTLTQDGGQEGQCGWCKDKFGVSWQILPSILPQLMSDPEKGQRVVQAFMKMKKFDIQALENA